MLELFSHLTAPNIFISSMPAFHTHGYKHWNLKVESVGFVRAVPERIRMSNINVLGSKEMEIEVRVFADTDTSTTHF